MEASIHAPNPSSVPAFCTPPKEVLNASIHTPIEHEHGSLKVTSFVPPSRVPATEPAKKTSSTSLHHCPSPPTPPLLRATRGLSASIHAPSPPRNGLSASIHAPSSLPWPGSEASIHAPNPASIPAFCTPPREVLCANIHAPVEYEPEFLNSAAAPFVSPVTEPSSSNTSLECYYSTPYPPGVGWGLGTSMHAPSPPSTGLSASIHAPSLLPTHPPDVCTLALNETPIEDEDELFTEPRPIPVIDFSPYTRVRHKLDRERGFDVVYLCGGLDSP